MKETLSDEFEVTDRALRQRTPVRLSLYLRAAFASLAAACEAFGQGGAFTYQGRLNDNGVPANGTYALQFRVYDASTGGTVLGGPLTQAGVAVNNGLFTVTLDFGASVFTGPARWLDIGVSANGGGFTTLSPRQPLTPSPYAIHAGTASTVLDGAVAKSINGLKDDITLLGGANVTIGRNGNTLTIGSTGGGGSGGNLWSLNGANAFYDGGNVGIGTTTPNHRLRISGGPPWTGHGWGGALQLDNASAIAWNANASGNHFGIGQTTDGLFFFGTASDPGTGGIPPTYRMVIANSGNVGIGTPWGQAPSSKLTVYEPGSGYGIEHTDGTVALGTYVNSAGGWFGTYSKHKLHFFVSNGSGFGSVIGRTGVRKTGLQPPAIFDPGFIIQPPVDPPIVVQPPDGPPVVIQPPIDPPLVIQPPGGGVEPPVVLGRTPSVTIDTNGNVGIGTENPAEKLHVAGHYLLVDGVANEKVYIGGDGIGNDAQLGSANPSVTHVVLWNKATQRRMNLVVSTLEITGGGDLAEPFEVKGASAAQPGMVVSIDPEHPGTLTVSSQSYDKRVAGIISGAGGVNPGVTLKQSGTVVDGAHPVALTGRVYAKADATFGAILPGDLLTTSDTPGHAMKVNDHAKAQGAILGKAMSRLAEGQGMVLVLVTLQ